MVARTWETSEVALKEVTSRQERLLLLHQKTIRRMTIPAESLWRMGRRMEGDQRAAKMGEITQKGNCKARQMVGIALGGNQMSTVSTTTTLETGCPG